MSMYRQFISQADYDEIANGKYSDPDSYPHCNSETFHEPGTCPFCDGHYKSHPHFRPDVYAPREANGWGGNMAPILDDAKAAEEQAQWDRVTQEFIDGTYDANERSRVDRLVEGIVSRFRKKQ